MSRAGTLRWICDRLSDRRERGGWRSLDDEAWRQMLSLAREEGVAPLLRRRFEEAGWPEDVPADVESAFHRAYFAASANNLIFFQELGRVLEVLGPGVAVLKGADLALTVYPNVALRPMCDVDLLVRRERIHESVSRLSRLGYRYVVPEVAPGHRERNAFAAYLVGGPKDHVAVELHWGLVAGHDDRRSPPDLDWFWGETESVTRSPESEVGSPAAFVHLTPSAHLLYLAAHLILQHGGARLIWYYDLHLLVTTQGQRLDWDTIVSRAGELGWTGALWAAMRGVCERFGTTLPDGLLQEMETAPGANVGLERQPLRGAKPYDEAAWDEMMSLGWPARLRYLRDHAFPSSAYMRWRYGPSSPGLWVLYYPYRWGVFLWRGTRMALRMVGVTIFRFYRNQGKR